jgi:hypothetical protein
VLYTADGITNVFPVPFEYLDKSHIVATVNQEVATFSWLTNNTIQLDVTPTNGALIKIMRITPRDSKLVDFKDSAMLTGEELNKAIDQVFYTQQELDETVIASFTDYREMIESKVIEASAHAANAKAYANSVNPELLQHKAEKDQPGGYAGLDANGKINSEWIKDASEIDKGVVKVGSNISVAGGVISVPEASETVKGVVELATPAEVLAGEDTERAVTPAGFKAAVDDLLNIADPVWGSISGTLSDQTDLQTALNGKANTSHSHNYAPIPTSSSLPVGAWCLCMYAPPGSSGDDIPNGGTVAGSLLSPICPQSGTSPSVFGGKLTGTWKNIFGATVEKPGTNKNSGLFVRIA